MRNLGWVLFAIGCGGGSSGEPLGAGTVNMTVGGDKTTFNVGVAVQDVESPTKMLVQIGTTGVDCGTNLQNPDPDDTIPSGSYVYFAVDKTPAMANTGITVLRLTRSHASLNSSSGVVAITAADARVAGSITFATNDSDDGDILVSGTFDVLRCF